MATVPKFVRRWKWTITVTALVIVSIAVSFVVDWHIAAWIALLWAVSFFNAIRRSRGIRR